VRADAATRYKHVCIYVLNDRLVAEMTTSQKRPHVVGQTEPRTYGAIGIIIIIII